MVFSTGHNSQAQFHRKFSAKCYFIDLCQVDSSVHLFRQVRLQFNKGGLFYFIFFSLYVLAQYSVFNANSVDYNQTPWSAESDLVRTVCLWGTRH